ncbi:MAG: hypothetical protein ABPD24_00265 [Candidatus Shikimatogenerans sp. AspAUS03]|uniref:phosphoglycerate kinase n=1 Tax=Candidatus Shikimatogenerans sp. AspAUS03 TaxID=3158563 RepID=A0AAU7QT61_9FLAO
MKINIKSKIILVITENFKKKHYIKIKKIIKKIKSIILINYYKIKKNKYFKLLIKNNIKIFYPKDLIITNKISKNSIIKYIYNKKIKKYYKYYDLYYKSILYFKNIFKKYNTIIYINIIGNVHYKIFFYSFFDFIKDNLKYKKKIFLFINKKIYFIKNNIYLSIKNII